MKTDGTPLRGSYFELAAAKHPDLKEPESQSRRQRPTTKPRRLGVVPAVLLGALVGVAWMVFALRPEENVRLATPAVVEAPAAQAPVPAQQGASGVENAPAAVRAPEPESPDAVRATADQPPAIQTPEPSRDAEAATSLARAARLPESVAQVERRQELPTPEVDLEPVSTPQPAEVIASPPERVAESPVTSQSVTSERETLEPVTPEPAIAESTPEPADAVASVSAPIERGAAEETPVEPESAVASLPEAPTFDEPRPELASDIDFQPPRKLVAPAPPYPTAARRAGEEGTVVVEADIDASGTVTHTTLINGRSPSLDAAALATVETWRFEPARRNGQPVASSYRLSFEFALSEDETGPAPTDSRAPEPIAVASAAPREVSAAIEPPRRLETPMPAYPNAAWVAGVAGDVLLRAVIDEKGDVTDVQVLRGLPHGMTEAAVAAILRWKFEPATLDGEPVAVYRNLSVSFEG